MKLKCGCKIEEVDSNQITNEDGWDHTEKICGTGVSKPYRTIICHKCKKYWKETGYKDITDLPIKPQDNYSVKT